MRRVHHFQSLIGVGQGLHKTLPIRQHHLAIRSVSVRSVQRALLAQLVVLQAQRVSDVIHHECARNGRRQSVNVLDAVVAQAECL